MPTIDVIYDPKATTIPVIRYLVAVADHRHFGRAAAACAVSQPTLSAQVARWERRLGRQVFERSGAGVRPTPVGEAVIAAARRVLAELQALEAAASSGAPPFFGPLRIGVIPTLGPYLLPLAGPAIAARWPELDWKVSECPTLELLARLERDQLDAAMVAVVAGVRAQRETEVLFEEPFLAALPRGHRLAAAASVAPSELGEDRLLLLEDGHCLRDQALELCGAQRSRREAGDYLATSLETLRQFVALGHGVTVLPALAAHATRADERIAIRRLSGARASRTIALAWRKGDVRGGGFRELAQVVAEAVRRHRAPWMETDRGTAGAGPRRR